MENKTSENFDTKFDKLTPENQKYIIAIQQALIFAQTNEFEKHVAYPDNMAGYTYKPRC